MNNEPVAWIAYDEFGDFMLEATPEGDYPWQPLYTHPAKTLTDKEIEELKKELEWAKNQWNKDRICFETHKAELEKDLALKTRDRDVFKNFTLAYEERIAELEKDLKYFIAPCNPACKPSVCDCFQARFAINNRKTLTDEEMIKIADETLGDSFDYDIMWLRMFVQAILRKAQEK